MLKSSNKARGRRGAHPFRIHIFTLLPCAIQIHSIESTDRKREYELHEAEGHEEDSGEGDVDSVAEGTHFGGEVCFDRLYVLRGEL